MGLFEKAGRRFEQFKKKAEAAAGEEADYECAACGTRLYTEQDHCPECGADGVVPVETAGEGSDSADESDPSEDDPASPADDGAGSADGDDRR